MGEEESLRLQGVVEWLEGDEFLTVKEAAELLRVRPSTIYNLVSQGRLKRYPIGPLSFRRTDVKQLMEEKELLTVKEAADLLLVHPSIIRHMVKEGRLKAYPIGKRLRFKREDINALLGR